MDLPEINAKARLSGLLFLFVLVCSVCVLGTLNSINQDFYIYGSGTFNNLNKDYASFVPASGDFNASNGHIIRPLLIDLDDDGSEEIVSVDGVQLKLYGVNESSNSFYLRGAYTLGDKSITNIMAIDDDDPAVFVVTDNQMFHSLTWNGSAFTHSNQSFSISSNELGFGCGTDVIVDGSDRCVIYGETFGLAIAIIDIDVTDREAVYTNTTTSYSRGCGSGLGRSIESVTELRGVYVADADYDDVKEVYFTAKVSCASPSFNTVSMVRYGVEGVDYVDESECDPGYSMTAPIVTDLNGLSSDGQSVIFACMVDDSNYKIIEYSPDLVKREVYPLIAGVSFGDIEGTLLSNMFTLDCFAGTGRGDVGVLGYNEDDDTVNLGCITQRINEDGFDREFIPEEIPNAGNLTSQIVYASFMGSSARDNILTNLGIFDLDAVEGIFDDGGISLIWEAPRDGIVLAGDPNSVGLNDIIIATYTNLWFIDDLYTNTNPSIEIEVDPCNPILLNESANVLITMSDIDGDNVRVRMFSYYGDDNEQDTGWSSYVASGTTLHYGFEANKTGLNYVLLVAVEDDDDGSEGNSSIAYTFHVSNSGNERGDCTSVQITDPVDPDDPLNYSIDPTPGNSVDDLIEDLDDSTGLGASFIWILVMAGVGWAIFSASPHNTPGQTKITFGALALVEFMLLIFGVKSGYISAGIIYGLIVVAVAVIIYMVKSRGE